MIFLSHNDFYDMHFESLYCINLYYCSISASMINMHGTLASLAKFITLIFVMYKSKKIWRPFTTLAKIFLFNENFTVIPVHDNHCVIAIPHKYGMQ